MEKGLSGRNRGDTLRLWHFVVATLQLPQYCKESPKITKYSQYVGNHDALAQYATECYLAAC